MPPPPPPPSAATPAPPAADVTTPTPTTTEQEEEPVWTIQWCLDGWHDAREAVKRMLSKEKHFRVRALDPDGPSLAEQCRGAHVLIPTTGQVDAQCIAAALPTLKIIAQPASAVGNIDLSAAQKAGVPVTHAPGHNAAATAEVAVMLLLMLLRRAPEAPAMIAQREVGRPVGREARGRTLGVVGITGRVGSRVARAAAALGMRVIGVDSRGARAEFSVLGEATDGGDEERKEEGIGRTLRPSGCSPAPAAAPSPSSSSPPASFKRGLRALLEESDAVTLHIPLSRDTQGIIGKEEFDIMARKGALFVNTARAGIVDRAALEEALGPAFDEDADERPPRLSGAALDVMWEEPCDPQDPLLKHPRVIVLPHLGCASEEAYAALAGVLVRNIRAARQGRWADLEHRVV
jgi:phosphoglycerate dehydrogenase-like enzyme